MNSKNSTELVDAFLRAIDEMSAEDGEAMRMKLRCAHLPGTQHVRLLARVESKERRLRAGI
jgi:hypothetical protein